MKIIKYLAICLTLLAIGSTQLEARGRTSTSLQINLGSLFVAPKPEPVLVERRVVAARPIRVLPVRPLPVQVSPVNPSSIGSAVLPHAYYEEVYVCPQAPVYRPGLSFNLQHIFR